MEKLLGFGVDVIIKDAQKEIYSKGRVLRIKVSKVITEFETFEEVKYLIVFSNHVCQWFKIEQLDTGK